VKIKQGILNGTLREAYLKHRSRSERKQRNLKQSIRMSQHPRYPSLYGNITSFPKITPSK
ncbi:ISLre2 family transposase, partial [Weizmannia sp. CD-2023]|nr:ISLre2 family transposase [Weizmannia sp. CD-2023]